MEPATAIIRKLGGPSVVSRLLKVHRTRVSNWMRPKAGGGTGGRIPQDHHRALLDYAREHKIPLTAEEFLPPTEASRSPPEQTGART